MEGITLIVWSIVFLGAGIGIGYYTRQLIMQQRKSSIEARLKKLVEDSRAEAKEVLLDAKEKASKITDEAKSEEKERVGQIRKLEERLLERESLVDKRVQQFEKKEKDLEDRIERVKAVKVE